MLGIDLREHHQLGVGRIASCIRERAHQVVDLVGRQRQPELGVGALQGGPGIIAERHAGRRPALGRLEQSLRRSFGINDRSGHSIVQMGEERLDRPPRLGSGQIAKAQHHQQRPLDAPHPVEAAVARDIRGFARPGRNGSRPGHHEHLT